MDTYRAVLDSDIRDFITQHQETDVATLALKTPPSPDWPYPLILDQIKARQKAAKKLPLWLTHHHDIIFPPSALIEQASSAATARYKAGLVKGTHFIDLTGGAGVDSCALSEHYGAGICVEKDQALCDLIAHNMPLLTNKPIDVICNRAEDFIKDMPQTDLVYIDPQRRTDEKKGLYRFELCSPNIKEMLTTLKARAQYGIIKASPMLDIDVGIADLEHVSHVHVVEWRSECKELLFVLDFKQNYQRDHVPVTAVIIDDNGQATHSLTFTQTQEHAAIRSLSAPLKYLYEPGPALQKSGASNMICSEFNLRKLHKNTQLYTSNMLKNGFPGRVFEILGAYNVQKKHLPVKKANLTVRNFPLSTPNLKKKLGIEDGGDDYLFACTLMDERKTLLHCRKTL